MYCCSAGNAMTYLKIRTGLTWTFRYLLIRDNSALHARHFGTEYNKKYKLKNFKKQIQHLFVCSLKLSLKRIISNKIGGIVVCCLNDNSTIIIQTLLFCNDIVYFEYIFVIVIKIVQIN